MRTCPPTVPASLGKSNSELLRVAPFSIRFLTFLCKAAGKDFRRSGFRVPNTKRIHFGEFLHVLAVPARAAHGTITVLMVGQTIRAASKHGGCNEALNIPFPWR